MIDKDKALSLEQTLRLALEYVELVPDDRYSAEHIDQDALITAIKAALLSRSDGEAQTRSVDKDELLEALKASRTYVAYAYSNGIVGAEDVGHMLDAAIAKATGENNG